MTDNDAVAWAGFWIGLGIAIAGIAVAFGLSGELLQVIQTLKGLK